MAKNSGHADHVDALRAQWRRVRPDLDTAPMGVLGRINRISLLVAEPIAAVMSEHGIDRGEFDVLASLRREGKPHELTPTRLYTSLMLSSGGLTNRLKRLARKGLIGRRPDPSDGRGELVCLTAAGRRVVDAVVDRDMNVEAALLQALTAQQHDALEGLLRRLAKALEADRG